MASLKDNINNFSDDTRTLINDHLRLFSIKQTEKLARFFGLLSTIFILSIILLIFIIFFSFAIAGILNNLLNTLVWGYLIVSGIYILVILFIILVIRKTKKPLLANPIAKALAVVFEIESKHPNDLDGLAMERELVKERINSNKDKINTHFELLRYSLMEHFFKEFFGLFKSRKKEKPSEEENSDDPQKKSKKE